VSGDGAGRQLAGRIPERARTVRARLSSLAAAVEEVSRELGALHVELDAACVGLSDREAARQYRDSGVAAADGRAEELAGMLLAAVSGA
jgi:hypothetical protein